MSFLLLQIININFKSIFDLKEWIKTFTTLMTEKGESKGLIEYKKILRGRHMSILISVVLSF